MRVIALPPRCDCTRSPSVRRAGAALPAARCYRALLVARLSTMHASTFQQNGYTILPDMLDAQALRRVAAALCDIAIGERGARQLLTVARCAALAETSRMQLVDAGLMAPDYVSVQCTFFEKSRERYWLVALRLHIDDCGVEDGALKVVPGSHREGRLHNAGKVRLRDEKGEVPCPVPAGSGMAMRPLLVHASSKASGDTRRRVLHFVFGPVDLPHGLAWTLRETPGIAG